MNRTFFLLYFILCFFSFSCQKEIEVSLPNYEKKLVVEGYIENGKFPIVTLSRSISYFSPLNVDTFLQKVLVKDATIFIRSSTGESEFLTYQVCEDSPLGFAYVGDSIQGEFNTTYYLEITWNDEKYNATTSILQPFALDSVWFAPIPDMHRDSAASLRILMTDNGNQKDYYQFFVKVNAKTFRDRYWVTSIPVAIDDASFNGQTFNFEIFRANPSSLLVTTMSEEEKAEYYRMTFRRGDTVIFRYASIDFQSYRYWASASSDIAFGQNPFMNPPPILSNIEGKNVVGVWCGYASTIDTLYY